MAKKSNRKGDNKGRKKPGPWRVDGISAEAAALAEQAAIEAGLPLGTWLGRLVRDTAQRERREREQQRARATEA